MKSVLLEIPVLPAAPMNGTECPVPEGAVPVPFDHGAESLQLTGVAMRREGKEDAGGVTVCVHVAPPNSREGRVWCVASLGKSGTTKLDVRATMEAVHVFAVVPHGKGRPQLLLSGAVNRVPLE